MAQHAPIIQRKRDPVTGKTKKTNPLNKDKLSKHEMDEYMIVDLYD